MVCCAAHAGGIVNAHEPIVGAPVGFREQSRCRVQDFVPGSIQNRGLNASPSAGPGIGFVCSLRIRIRADLGVIQLFSPGGRSVRDVHCHRVVRVLDEEPGSKTRATKAIRSRPSPTAVSCVRTTFGRISRSRPWPHLPLRP